MHVVTRSEINRNRIGALLGIVLGVLVLSIVVGTFSGASQVVRLGLVLFGVLAAATIVVSLVQLLSHRKPSRAIIFREGDQTIVAASHLHESFKLRFFREVLGEYMVEFSNEERERWKALEQVGFHPVFNFHNVRKTVLLPLAFMVFEEVFVMDHTDRWDYFDCRNTSEPTFSERGVGPFSDDSIVLDIKHPKSQVG